MVHDRSQKKSILLYYIVNKKISVLISIFRVIVCERKSDLILIISRPNFLYEYFDHITEINYDAILKYESKQENRV